MNEVLPLRVCVVDDESRLRDVMVREIRAMGHSAAGFPSAEEAWSPLRDGQFDIAILDLNLPGMSGMELFERIRTATLDTAVVILTGYGSLESAVQSLRWDAEDYLSKPCTLGELESVLARLHAAKRRSMPNVSAEGMIEESIAQPPNPDSSTTLEEYERYRILLALANNDGNKLAAARELAISVRTLYNKLNAYRAQGIIP